MAHLPSCSSAVGRAPIRSLQRLKEREKEIVTFGIVVAPRALPFSRFVGLLSDLANVLKREGGRDTDERGARITEVLLLRFELRKQLLCSLSFFF